MRQTDQEITAAEKIVCYSQFPRGGGDIPCHAGPQREAPVSVRRQRERGKAWARVFIVTSMGRNGQGRISRFRIGYFE